MQPTVEEGCPHTPAARILAHAQLVANAVDLEKLPAGATRGRMQVST